MKTETKHVPGKFDSSARASDIARSRRQYYTRKAAEVLVALFRLNRGGYVTTELIQTLHPVCRIPTSFGDLLCKGGHGRLRWRAETFYTEEPETVQWLDRIERNDVFWDIGANVGLYSMYAAKKSACTVYSFEPEAQNYAILVENVALNRLGSRVETTNLALTRKFCLGRLNVSAITKGGAFNNFSADLGERARDCPTQLQVGISIDELVANYGFECPTHIKIDVDGNEPEIIGGASQTLASPTVKSVLVELQLGLPDHARVVVDLESLGFRIASKRSNWDSREDRSREHEDATTNVIFSR